MPDQPLEAWTGRSDPGAKRWHEVVQAWEPGEPVEPGAVVLVGFASDEGVRRNQGRVGAAAGPTALREALASLAEPERPVYDAGDITVADGDLESAQAALGEQVRRIRAAGATPVVLGGGHEVAYGSHLGWADEPGWSVLNLDAHFDLRQEDRPTSGTPFRQIALAQERAGQRFRYAVAGISRPDNTSDLFATARDLGVVQLADEDCTPDNIERFVESAIAESEQVHLTVDLDCLPAAVAPGVSAPAGFGIDVAVVRQAVTQVARSGRLGLLEVAELNPRFDVDARTARTAARLIDAGIRALPSGKMGA